MTRYELLVEINGSKYYLDTFEYEPISLNYDIANIKDISGRNSSYSKTIRLPDSESNREILGFITNLAVDSTVDANKIIKSWIIVDTIPVFEGNLQLKKFQKNFKTGEMEIEVVVYADNDTFFTSMGDKYLTDLDLSEYNHIWSASNIRLSWTQSVGFPWRYPLIDYGSNWRMEAINGLTGPNGNQITATNSVTVDEMFPAISKKIIFDRIFQEAGFNYQSEFLNSDYFKNEYIPFSGVNLIPVSNEASFEVFLDNQTLPVAFLLTTYFNLQTSATNSYWNGTSITNPLSSDISMVFEFYIKISGTLNSGYPTFNIQLYNTTNNIVTYNQNVYSDPTNSGNGNTSFGFYLPGSNELTIQLVTPPIIIQSGKSYRPRLSWTNGTSLTISNLSFITGKSVSNIALPGMTTDITKSLPNKIKQRDFIISTCIEYNLYIEPSKDFQNSLIIEPRDDYYANGRIKDWSEKLDLNSQIDIDILAETQNRTTIFTHKEDKDYLNQNYKQQFLEIYGQYDFNSGNEFAKSQNKKIESIFSPTPLNLVPGSYGLIIPLITKDVLFSYNTDSKGKLETNIRTLQWGGLVKFNNEVDRFSFDGNYVRDYDGDFCYPYAGHLDNPYTPTVDNNFGDPIDVYFPNDGLTTNNLFNRFWYKTMVELTNKNSRIVTAYFYLTPQDIYNFRFSDKIYLRFDGNGQYYKVNKIMDYDPGNPKPCKVELLKTDEVKVNTFRAKFLGKGRGGGKLPSEKTERVEIGTVRTDVLDMGKDNDINGASLIVNGVGNTIQDTRNGIINGNGNVIDPFSDRIVVSGDENIIGTGSTDVSVFGNRNIIGTFSNGINVFGDDVAATQSGNYFGGNNIFSGTFSIDGNFQSGCLSITKFMGLEENIEFTTNLGTGFNNQINIVRVASDGKVLLGGSFTTFNGNTRNRLVRLNSDGTEDTSFYTNLGTGFSGGSVNHIEIQSDGKILVGGGFIFLNGNVRVALVRLNSNGTEDTSFYTNLGTSFNSTVSEIHLQSDGKILVGGAFTSLNGTTRNRLVRLNSNGTVDTSFYTNMGTAFTNGSIFTIYVQSDDKILVGGSFTTFNGNTRNRLVRLNSDGTEDTTFYTNMGTAFSSFINAVVEQPDGKILVGGVYFDFNGDSSIINIVRLNSDGTVDTDFTSNVDWSQFGSQVNVVSLLSSGKIIVGGNVTAKYFMGMNSDGSTDVDMTSRVRSTNATIISTDVNSSNSLLVTDSSYNLRLYDYTEGCTYTNESDFIIMGTTYSQTTINGDVNVTGDMTLSKTTIGNILKFVPQGATPSSPDIGDVFYKDGGALIYWNGIRWVPIGSDAPQYSKLSATQSLTVNNTTSAQTNITGWTFSFDANTYYQVEGYIDGNVTGASPTITNNIGLCITFGDSVDGYVLYISDSDTVYPSDWSSGANEVLGISKSSGVINTDARIRSANARFRINGWFRTINATSGQFKWTYRNSGNRTFNILSGSTINITKG